MWPFKPKPKKKLVVLVIPEEHQERIAQLIDKDRVGGVYNRISLWREIYKILPEAQGKNCAISKLYPLSILWEEDQ